MAHHAERLTEWPGGEGIGGETLVVKRDARLEIGILKVAVKGAQGCGHGQSLVADESAGKGRDVKGRLVFEFAFNFTTNEIEKALEVICIDVGGAADEEVGDFRLGQAGQFAELTRVDGDFTPADERNVSTGQDGLGEGFDIRCDAFGQEKDADSEVTGLAGVAEFFGCLCEKRARNLAEDAGSVTGLHICVDGTPVGHVANRGQGVVENLIGFLPTEVGNGSHSAVGGFVIPLVQSS